MRKLLSYILSPLFFLFFGLVLLVYHPFLVIAYYIFGIKALEWVMNGLIITMITLLRLSLWMKYDYINFKKVDHTKPTLFVSNHQSMWDIPPIMWYFRRNRPKFIAKKELAKFIPSVSFYLKHARHLTIDRSKSEDAISKIEEFANGIHENGTSIVIFPEGTRSKDGNLGYFKPKGIRTILEKYPEILIVPFAQHNTREIDNNGNFFKTLGIRIKIQMLEPRHFELENLDEQIEAMRQEIANAIGCEAKIETK